MPMINLALPINSRFKKKGMGYRRLILLTEFSLFG